MPAFPVKLRRREAHLSLVTRQLIIPKHQAMSSKLESIQGLSEAQVAESRSQYGANVFTPPARTPLWKQLLWRLCGPFGHYIKGGQDGDSLIFILEVITLLSFVTSMAEYFGWMGLTPSSKSVFLEPIGILCAVVLATGVSFLFETKAKREFELLNQTADDEPVRVVRSHGQCEVARRDVVVGDYVVLQTGDEVPADARLVRATALSIDESTLTGELLCHKSLDAESDEGAVYPSNVVLRGTKVMEGHGVAHVTAVGDATEAGRAFADSQAERRQTTPLVGQLDALGKLIANISYALAFLVFVARIYAFLHAADFDWAAMGTMDFGAYMLQTLMIAVTLIAVSVPEGLPMAVSLSLALSMRRMLRTGCLVRTLQACETMGAATVVCTDKTGTLTENRMQVSDILTGEDVQSVQQCMAICSTAALEHSESGKRPLGNPTEGALLLYLDSIGMDYQSMRQRVEIVDEVPFSTEHKYMSVTVRERNGDVSNAPIVRYVKGAPEVVMKMCDRLDSVLQQGTIDHTLQAWQRQARRTLAFAVEQIDVKTGQGSGLVLTGLCAIADPVRADVPEAVLACQRAGIRVKIVTGDAPDTAREIARQVHVAEEDVISRARPADKRKLVEQLQQAGEVVAVTGDGTNDAPALRAAHVGLSMGSGTAVAKEASDITLLDDSFASIVRAVLWGRSLYRNIRRFILFQLTVNVAACLLVLVGSVISTQAPLTVVQMLWVNLIMDTIAAGALASLPPSRGVLYEPPRRPGESIISRGMWVRILCIGGLFAAILIAALYILEHANVDSPLDLILFLFNRHTEGKFIGMSDYEQTYLFTLFVGMQFWNLFNARAFLTRHSALNLKGCRVFLMVCLVILIGQAALVLSGSSMFAAASLTIEDFCWCFVLTSPVLLVPEMMRPLYRMWFQTPRS